MNYYQEKAAVYFNNSRKDLISFLPQSPDLKVLEIGAGGGATLMDLKTNGRAAEVAGIELFELPGTFQSDPLINRFIIGDIEKMEVDLPKGHYDAILFGDVLEHLVDPWSVVDKLAAHLKPGGLFIASIPNVRSRQAFKNIFLKGDFRQDKQGLFDKTHLRWFCKKNMIDLLTSDTQKFVSATSNLEFKKKSGTKTWNRWTGRILEEFLTVQFVIVTQRIK
jgi:2-polyprenyl-3-methyl-5-hydroxy-6-metoxy-1,4-benzoquinol methylase